MIYQQLERPIAARGQPARVCALLCVAFVAWAPLRVRYSHLIKTLVSRNNPISFHHHQGAKGAGRNRTRGAVYSPHGLGWGSYLAELTFLSTVLYSTTCTVTTVL